MQVTHTLFYEDRYCRRFPVPLITFERMFIRIQEAGEDFSAEDFGKICNEVLQETCGIEKPSQEEIDYVAERFSSTAKDIEAVKSTDPTHIKGFGAKVTAYLQESHIDVTLLQMCNNDYNKARNMYCRVDRDDVLKMVAEYINFVLLQNQTMFEACVYGFGGEFKGDSTVTVNVNELSVDDLNQMNRIN